MKGGRAMKQFGVLALVLAALLAGCGSNEETGKAGQPQVGREETRKIRAADKVGYAGSAVANRLDKTLDATDARKRQTEEQAQ